MKSVTTIFGLCILLVFTLNCLSQNKTTDSLEKVIANSKQDTTKVQSILRLSNIYCENNPSSAISLANQARTLSINTGFKLGELKSLKSLGYAYYNQQLYNKSIDQYEMALKIAYETKNKQEQYNICTNIGDIYFEQNNYDKSLEFHSIAIKIADEMNRKSLVIEPMNFIASGFYSQAKYNEAYKYYLDALKICQNINDKQNAAIELLNIGSIFSVQKDYVNALKYYNEALKANEETNQKEESAKCLNNIGLIYENKNDLSKALEYYQKAYDIKIKGEDKTGIINSLTNIGNIFAKQNNYDKAINYYQDALNVSEKDNNKDGMARLMINIGKLYKKKGMNQDAILYLKNGISISKQIRLNEYMRSAYEDLADINSSQGDYKSAYQNHVLYSLIKDTIFSQKKNKDLMELQTKYETEKTQKEIQLQKGETEKREKEIQLQKEKIARQAFARNSFIIGCLFLVIIVLLLYNRYRIKQKTNEQLTTTNSELAQSNKTINEQSNEINQNISYAQRIQQTLLPDISDINHAFPHSFILYKPKAVVSGDFYWFSESKDGFTIAAIDCTGHGVSGAFMSVMAHNILFQMNKEIDTPKLILENIHENIRASLKQNKSENSRDGMDMAVCKFDKNMKFVDYSGAMRPMYHIRNGILTEYKSDKYCIGGYQSEDVRKFTQQRIELFPNDIIYLFSDGYADQFGGQENKKFMNKRLKDLLISISKIAMQGQLSILEQTFEVWKGSREQIDDILIIGIRI